VRLPTEPEWQQAATGGDPRNEYPWGPTWDNTRANTDESRLSRTTAVGMYPGGASSQRVLDLAGNVWEWCLTDYERPQASGLEPLRSTARRSSTSRRGRPDADRDKGVRRVVRGGSWLNPRDDARSAFRYCLHPHYRDGNIGFRVVRGSPIP
jgi:formylglycine-generating enzyme required for sulfatase activity